MRRLAFPKFLFSVAAAFFSLIVFSSGVPAHAAGGFMASPTKLEIKVKPGEQDKQIVRVTSLGDIPLKIESVISDYSINRNNVFTFSDPGHTTYSAARWIKIEPSRFTLTPNETQEVTIDVAVPSDIEPGGHYAAVLFQTASTPSDKTQPHLNIVSRLAVLMLASSGSEQQISRQGKILSFLVKHRPYSRQVRSEVLFQNQGNVHITLRGNVVYRDIFGRRAGTEDLAGITALPRTSRVMKSKWNGPAFGRFTATATVEYGPDLATFDTKQVSKEVVFWIVPWKPIVIGLVILAFILIAVSRWPRRKVGSHSVHGAS